MSDSYFRTAFGTVVPHTQKNHILVKQLISVTMWPDFIGKETPDVSLNTRCLHSLLPCRCFQVSLSLSAAQVHALTHTFLAALTVLLGDPQLFLVVDGQGEADLERPVPSLLDQPGLHCLHGKFQKAKVGGNPPGPGQPSPGQGPGLLSDLPAVREMISWGSWHTSFKSRMSQILFETKLRSFF